MTLFAADLNAGTQKQLAAYRQQIDSLDQRIVDLLQKRARVVEEVGKIKREAHLPVTAPDREQQVIEKAQECAKGGPLPPEAIGRIYQKLIEEMRNWEARLDGAASRSFSDPAGPEFFSIFWTNFTMRTTGLSSSSISTTVLPLPAVLDTAFVEMMETCDFDWRESLAVDRVHVGIAEIAGAALLLAGFVVLAWRTIFMLVLDQAL